jgi:hypothetical protein
MNLIDQCGDVARWDRIIADIGRDNVRSQLNEVVVCYFLTHRINSKTDPLVQGSEDESKVFDFEKLVFRLVFDKFKPSTPEIPFAII